jgi:hypothetical protein
MYQDSVFTRARVRSLVARPLYFDGLPLSLPANICALLMLYFPRLPSTLSAEVHPRNRRSSTLVRNEILA